MSRSRVFVGDLQGCADELEDLLAAIPFDPERHELWCAGDLVNRGPASARTLRRLMELGAGSVLGNHDLHLFSIEEGTRKRRGDETIDDILDAPDRTELLGWLRQRPLVKEWDDVILVHAGLHPSWTDSDLRSIAAPLERQIAAGVTPRTDPCLRFMTRVRHCNEEGETPPDELDPPAGFEPWDHFYTGTRIVVCGHWASRGVVSHERLRALDSGCVWGEKLTAWIAEEDRLVSVPARRAWARSELPRAKRR